MEVQGKIILIGATEQVSDNFSKRQVVVETAETYPQKLAVEFVKDKTALLDKFKVGDDISVEINLRGNEYKDKFYVNLQGWKITKSDGATPQYAKPLDANSGQGDDLPF